MRLGQRGLALITVLAVGCSAATPTAAPGSPAAPPPTSPGLDASGTLPTPGFPPPSPTDEPVGPTSTDLILAAHERGELSDEDAAVYRVFAAFGDERLPTEFQSESAGWEDHMATRDAAGLWDSLSAEQRVAIAPYFIPPIYAGSWADPAAEAGAGLTAGLGLAGAPMITAAVDPKDCASEQLHDQFYVNVPAAGGKVRIWWRNGIETSARAGTVASMLAQEVDANIWPKLTTLMGKEPLSDAGVGCFNGEDGALDIYLSDRFLGPGTQALTIAYPGACTNTPAFIIFDSRLIDPDFFSAWKYAHEIFHAIQFAYTYAGPCSNFAAMDEATAVWAAEYVYPADQFEWSGGGFGLASWFGDNSERLYNHNLDAYGDWPLFSSLSHRHGPELIPMLYQATETVDSDLDAIEIIAPGGIDGYWPQFVRDLWDDHEEHNVWTDWDPGLWSTATYEGLGGGGLVEVPRPGGGGILTVDIDSHWRIAPWSQSPCVTHPADNPNWGFVEQETVGSWTCPLPPEIVEPPPTATYERGARVRTLGREEHEYWFPDEDWPRYIKIKAPGLGSEDEHLSVQGFYQLRDGTWAGPLDWKGEDEIEFCRDQDDQDITRVAILYGNSEVPTGASQDIQGSYAVEVRKTCPASGRGTVTISREKHGTYTSNRNNPVQVDMTDSATITFELKADEFSPGTFTASWASITWSYSLTATEEADGCAIIELGEGGGTFEGPDGPSVLFDWDNPDGTLFGMLPNVGTYVVQAFPPTAEMPEGDPRGHYQVSSSVCGGELLPGQWWPYTTFAFVAGDIPDGAGTLAGSRQRTLPALNALDLPTVETVTWNIPLDWTPAP